MSHLYEVLEQAKLIEDDRNQYRDCLWGLAGTDCLGGRFWNKIKSLSIISLTDILYLYRYEWRAVFMNKPLAIGIENFKEIISKNYYYVDKTLFMKDLLSKGGKVNLFTRPRRFGKTLALSMIRTFFEKEMDINGRVLDNSGYFDGMKIMQAGEICLKGLRYGKTRSTGSFRVLIRLSVYRLQMSKNGIIRIQEKNMSVNNKAI